MIVKVQRSLATNDPEGHIVMIYAKGRQHVTQVRPAALPPWLHVAIIKEPKLFCEATWTGDKWRIDGPAKWQDW